MLRSGNRHNQRREHREQLVLGALQCVRTFEKCKSDEQSTHNVQEDLGKDVDGVSPQGSRVSDDQNSDLMKPRGRVFRMEFFFDRWAIPALSVDAVEFF